MVLNNEKEKNKNRTLSQTKTCSRKCLPQGTRLKGKGEMVGFIKASNSVEKSYRVGSQLSAEWAFPGCDWIL